MNHLICQLRESRETKKTKADKDSSHASDLASPQSQEQHTPTQDCTEDDDNELNRSDLYDWIEGDDTDDPTAVTPPPVRQLPVVENRNKVAFQDDAVARPSPERQPPVVENRNKVDFQDDAEEAKEETEEITDEIPKRTGLDAVSVQKPKSVSVSIKEVVSQSGISGDLEKSMSQESFGQAAGDFNGSYSSSDCSTEGHGILHQDSESSFDYGFKVIKESIDASEFYKPRDATNSKNAKVPNLLDVGEDNQMVNSSTSTGAPAEAKADDILNDVTDTDDNSCYEAARSQFSHNSTNNSVVRAQEWLKRVESRKQDIAAKKQNGSGQIGALPPIFVSANDENSTFDCRDMSGYEAKDSNSVFDHLDSESVFDFDKKLQEKESSTYTRGVGCFNNLAPTIDWKPKVSPSKSPKPIHYGGICTLDRDNQSATRGVGCFNNLANAGSPSKSPKPFRNGDVCTLDRDNQSNTSDITDHASEASNYGPNNVQSFLSRLTSCTTPECTAPRACTAPTYTDTYTTPIMTSFENCNDSGELPFAHLEFLRKSQDLGSKKSQDSGPSNDHQYKETQEKVFGMFSAPRFCGRPESIYEEDEEDEEEDEIVRKPIVEESKFNDNLPAVREEATQDKASTVGSSASVASAYLNALRTNSLKESNSDIISPTAQAHGMYRSRSKKSNISAEAYATKKVNEMIRTVTNEETAIQRASSNKAFVSRLRDNVVRRHAKQTSSTAVRAAEELAAVRIVSGNRPYGEPAQAMRRSDAAKAAGELAANRVETMMYTMNNANIEEGEV